MESSLALKQAEDHIKKADHIISITYPLVEENKLLISCIEHAFLAFTNALGTFLSFEFAQGKIKNYEDNFDAKIAIYREYIAKRHDSAGFSIDYAVIMEELRNLISMHRKSVIEISRQNSLVICNNTYEMQVINPEKAKLYVAKAKLFIHLVKSMVGTNE